MKECYIDDKGSRICTIDNETLKIIIENCKEFLIKRDTLYLDDIELLLSKALNGITNKNDLTDSEKLSIKAIRNMIKGL